MLSLQQKRDILNAFDELRERQDQFGRFFYYFDGSRTRKKMVGREFLESGNGYVYGELLPAYQDVLYQDGSVCVKDFTADQLKSIVKVSIDSLR